MDFDRAAARLANDQNKLRSARRSRGAGLALSARARNEAEERRRRAAERSERTLRERRGRLAGVRYMERCDGRLGVDRSLAADGAGGDQTGLVSASAFASAVGRAALPSWSPGPSLLLRPVSIHGDGDKLSLPPSVLSTLANCGLVGGEAGQQQPLAFRIGVPDAKYSFPASASLRVLIEKASESNSKGGGGAEDGGDGDGDGDGDSDSDGDSSDGENSEKTAPYRDELAQGYLSYTHATVVEFTMEEGQVGLPKAIASLLLENDSVPRTRTVDPAGEGTADPDVVMEKGAEDENGSGSSTESAVVAAMDTDADEEKTPGHLAWGRFDVPDADVSITLVKLPRGKACTLVPTREAAANGFYKLKDVKLVLEQSLIRTRATLSVSDVVHTWHRGVKFDLVVRDVTPPDFGAVSCINTDIEVDLAPLETPGGDATEVLTDGVNQKKSQLDRALSPFAPGTGYKLSGDTKPQSGENGEIVDDVQMAEVSLPSEPPSDQKVNVCTIQVRGDGATGKRRFDTSTATVRDVFAFASFACNLRDADGKTFRLVTRFPRRVFAIDSNDAGDIIGAAKKLSEAGIMPGQEMLMVEKL